MKQIANQYAFDASERKVTIEGLEIPQARLLLIVNASRNQVLYNFAGGSGASAYVYESGDTIITLAADTTAFSDSDSLTIYYDDGASREEVTTLTDIDSIKGSNPAAWLVAGDVPVGGENFGSKFDSGASDTTGNWSLVALTKGILAQILGKLPALTESTRIPVALDSDSNLKVTGPLTDTQLRASAVPVYGEKFKVIANWSWSAADHSPTLNLTAYRGSILRITGEWNGDGAPKTYRVVRSIGNNISVTNQEVQDWTTGTVITAGTGTESGDFYYRVPSNLGSQTSLQLSKLSGDNVGTNSATIYLYDESDVLEQGRSVVLSKPLTDEQLRATRVATDPVKAISLSEIIGTCPASSTEVLASSSSRNYLLIQNLSSSPFHLSFGGTASTSSLRIDAGGSIVFDGGVVASNSVRMIQTQAGQNFYIAHA